MKRQAGLVISGVIVLGLAACTDSDAALNTSDAAGNSGSSGATLFREHRITDPGMNNIVATTVLVPEGWKYGQLASGSWQINLMYSVRGPVGTDYLNDPQMMAILHSARPNPVWLAEMNKHWMAMARIRQQGAQQRQQQAQAAHQKRMQTLNETSAIIANGYRPQSQARDAGHDRYINSIHEVTPYQVPGGETVKLPSFYDHVYTDNNGRYLLNNDANYQPNTDPTVNERDWQRIEPQR